MINEFRILSKYNNNSGVQVALNGKVMQLTVQDICYLLIDVDGKATDKVENLSSQVKFGLDGVQYNFTDEEWQLLIDELTSVAGAGGWNHLMCNNP